MKKQILLNVSPELYEKMVEAKHPDSPMSAFIRNIISDFLEKNPDEK